jgi:hypothetical protein
LKQKKRLRRFFPAYITLSLLKEKTLKLYEIQEEHTVLKIYSVEAENEDEAREIFETHDIEPKHVIEGEKEITKITFQEDL